MAGYKFALVLCSDNNVYDNLEKRLHKIGAWDETRLKGYFAKDNRAILLITPGRQLKGRYNKYGRFNHFVWKGSPWYESEYVYMKEWLHHEVAESFNHRGGVRDKFIEWLKTAEKMVNA